MKEKALLIFSGGQDSTTCLYWAIANGFDVHTITFNYGQKHSREIEQAEVVAAKAGVRKENQTVVYLPGGILDGTSPLTNADIELEQYEDHASLPGGLEKTFVPMRNQLFITLAANRAYCQGIGTLITGVCQEDNGGYPDCRQSFIDAIEVACNLGTFTGEGKSGPVSIKTPLMNLSKAETVLMALHLPVSKGFDCYAALADSHTAYDGQFPPYGQDHATLLREKGFFEAGVPDPIWIKAMAEGHNLPERLQGSANYLEDLILKYAMRVYG